MIWLINAVALQLYDSYEFQMRHGSGEHVARHRVSLWLLFNQCTGVQCINVDLVKGKKYKLWPICCMLSLTKQLISLRPLCKSPGLPTNTVFQLTYG